ncbi:MAG TPA: SUMF1/EgtB/PvdO family nonheme iron enzyme [Solirubrobacteraceae bacterium]|jgi:iron(II)-dependent oxidoreductase|nr:SUMF1/EgtB/PvdO family nonheme iron enzyme [Solirubrobacteraceae bacterium]
MAPLASRDTIAPPALPDDAEEALAALDSVRARTLELVCHLDDERLARQHSPILSPLVWDLAHIAAYEDLWLCHRHAGLPLLRPELAEIYDAFETPRAVRGEIELLGPDGAREYLADVRAHTARALGLAGVGDGTLFELVLRHELQHTETMLQAMALAGLLPEHDTLIGAGCTPPGPLPGEQRWVEIPAGHFQMGAGPDGFAYDNERPRHAVEVDAFAIARLPVSNGEWAAGGGEPRAGAPEQPVCHVSWQEADAFARAQGARLPTEAEWERAATLGALEAIGRVWEWTSSDFYGYPGFLAHPYREYSEVFFGDAYKVLRGGSWATHFHVKTLTFRNWDLPIRSQIFAGVRLARDAG